MSIDLSEFDALIKQVGRGEKLRVWSLIITFFGDAVMPHGGVVSAASISTIMTKLGIEAGAVRTALSRLANDGWVVREKIGRNAFYRLSPTGLEPFQKAEARIYACSRAEIERDKSWVIAIAEPGETSDMSWVEQFEGLCFAPNIALFNSSSTELHRTIENEGCLYITGELTAFPKWLTQWVQPQKSQLAYQQMINMFEGIKPENALEAMAVRTLLIHQWRRQLLRTPDLPASLFTNDWVGFACREHVCSLYKQILPLSEQWLDEHIDGKQSDQLKRFG